MGSKNDIVLAFDAYGTLLSTESIAKKLGDHFGNEKAQDIAATWRKASTDAQKSSLEMRHPRWRSKTLANFLIFTLSVST